MDNPVDIPQCRFRSLALAILVAASCLASDLNAQQQGGTRKVGEGTARTMGGKREEKPPPPPPRKPQPARPRKEADTAKEAQKTAAGAVEKLPEGEIKNKASEVVNTPLDQPDDILKQMLTTDGQKAPAIILSILIVLVGLMFLVYGWPLFRGLFIPFLAFVGLVVGFCVGAIGAAQADLGGFFWMISGLLTGVASGFGLFWLGLKFSRLGALFMMLSIGIGGALMFIFSGDRATGASCLFFFAIMGALSMKFLRFVVIVATALPSAVAVSIFSLGLFYASGSDLLIKSADWVLAARWHLYLIILATAFVGLDAQYVLGPAPLGEEPTDEEVSAMNVRR
ncbi:MAG TPA: hypothetical protein PL033_19505 [Candidatus Brocadiia bacterium]|nr:hypothetical protein [Candidatus Brocadiia bacterium]